jgi:glycosyltransferase involved in cell wall biosynthesis
MIHRALLKRYNAFLYIGEGNRRFYLSNGVLEDRLFFAPYCVENERFRRAALELTGQRAEIRATWEIPPDAVTFVFCGKLIGKKRPMDVLRALSELTARPDELPPIHVVIVGAGELLAECQSYAKNRRLPVTFPGFLNQSEISRAYVAADCLVLPSDDGETWGLVVNEGMACGLPAIVSDAVGCQQDLVVDGETGAVYPMGNVEALAACLRTAASNGHGLRNMGVAAEARVARYSYDQVLRGTLAALDSLGVPIA